MPFLYGLPRSKTYDHISLRWHNLNYDFYMTLNIILYYVCTQGN
nr:MAG TPA: hypothetical protein [Caudoviricetes sp.]DAT99527.1 MAG TPA: hypothetical protein [Caudoviricetes sp.]